MSPTERPNFSSMRSKYAYLFDSLAELFRFHYGEKPSTKFSDIPLIVGKMEEDGFVDQYLSENLSLLFNNYPTLLPSNLESALKKNQDAEYARLKNLDALLDIIIGDVCNLIFDLVNQAKEHDKEQLFKSLLG